MTFEAPHNASCLNIPDLDKAVGSADRKVVSGERTGRIEAQAATLRG